MASEVAIANLALSHLGNDATIASLTEQSAEAEYCRQWYPHARDVLLSMHNWSFATRRIAPAAVTVDEDVYGEHWDYGYRMPADCLQLINLLPIGYDDDENNGLGFTVESDELGQVILTTEDVAAVRYTRRITDTNLFPPLFTDALSWLLASFLAGPVLKGDVGQQAAITCYATFETQFKRATLRNANQAKARPTHKVPWVTARA